MFVLNQTRFHIDDAVAAPCVKAADQAAFGDADRDLSLVAVAPRLVHAKRRADDDALLRHGVAIGATSGSIRTEAA
ncbi:hypothetical protein HMSSN036_56070 [Paenibacillus macerans]|nr:hypothetical protein HMSSN036_56070 [Paenibacillus macerans]